MTTRTETYFKGTPAETSFHKTSEYQFSKNDYNDVIERSLTKVEGGFRELSKLPIVPLVTGPLRALYGCIEVVGAIFYALFKIVLNAPFNVIFHGKKAAMVSLNEGGRALTYIPHGIFNIGVGVLETLHVGQDSTISRQLSWSYPSRKNPRPVPREELLSMPTPAEQRVALFDGMPRQAALWAAGMAQQYGEL